MKKENAIEVKHISKSFKIYHDKAHQLKDAVVFHNFRKKQKVEKRLILDDISFEVKQSAETQPGNELYFTGSDGAQIHTAYEATREQYLDIGHVKAVIFGTSLRENRERLREVLMGMESESSLGNSLCIFTTDSLSELSQAVEEQGISLGDFLTGLYENRTNSSAQAPVKLADLYRSCHTDTALPQIPGITVKDRVLMVEKK